MNYELIELQTLENNLLGRLGVSENDLYDWENNEYLADSNKVSKFWSYIDLAPAIAIVGDYDCDGICGSYIMSKSIKEKYPSKKMYLRIPHRFSEGYGFKQSIAEEIIEKLPQGSLVITVDNGIAAAESLEWLKSQGYKVIVTDHHELGANKIPEVDMVLNPTLNDGSFDGSYWCGAAVAFKLCEQVISESLKNELENYAGLATVGDCMQLVEGNWGLTKRVINNFTNSKAPKALVDLLKAMKQEPKVCTSETFGYYLSPAFNAAGRLNDKGATEVLSYLLKPSEEGLCKIINYNEQRKAIRDQEYEIVQKAITEQKQENACPIWVYVPNLHEGIVGILAGKVTEDYKVPAIILTDSKTPGILKGSARSVNSFNIFSYLESCGNIYEGMGGHAGAAGLSIQEKYLEIARSHQIDPSILTAEKSGYPYLVPIQIDDIPVVLPIIKKISPFGEGNPTPYFEISINTKANNANLIGPQNNHLSIETAAYKVLHFFHTPNDLKDKGNFDLIGHINESIFKGIIKPTFIADELLESKNEHCDVESPDYEKF